VLILSLVFNFLINDCQKLSTNNRGSQSDTMTLGTPYKKFVTIMYKEISSSFCNDLFMTRVEICHFRQVANKNQNSGEIVFEDLR
jgi:hypothetical protein